MSNQPSRRWWYPTALLIIYSCWATLMTTMNWWGLFQTNWPYSLTMAFGSFVAGSTAAGGGAVAYPVFTKLLHVPSNDARTFSLMIQSFGMSMASLTIFALRAPVLPKVIGWSSLGGAFGMVIGSLTLSIPSPYPKIIFTTLVTLFGITLLISRFGFKHHRMRHNLPEGRGVIVAIVVTGFIGGLVSSVVGSGIDMILFMLMTLALGIDEKVGTLTSVPIMAINSVVGFFTHGVIMQDIGIVWEYWVVCVPIVILGAPLGSFVASKVNRDLIIWFLITLICAEAATTIAVTALNASLIQAIVAVILIGSICFAGMLYYRSRMFAQDNKQFSPSE